MGQIPKVAPSGKTRFNEVMRISLKLWTVTFIGLGLLILTVTAIARFKIPPPSSQPATSLQPSPTISTPSVTINNHTLEVEVADTEEKQRQGLAGHEPLSDTQGMLFPYNPPQPVTFWMKGMTFPIDIIYIAGGRVVQTYENVPPPQPGMPDDALLRYPAQQPVDYVLETPSGWTKNHQISVGEPVRFKI